MTGILGRFLILASVFVATGGAFVGFAAGQKRSAEGLKWVRRFAYAFAALMLLATLVMEYALLTHDFSVQYVEHVGSREVPTWVTIVSLWSSLEGSILFWGCILGFYITGAVWLTRGKHEDYMPYAIGTWLGCGAFFSFLIAAPANPFLTVPNPPLDGPGPNPLVAVHEAGRRQHRRHHTPGPGPHRSRCLPRIARRRRPGMMDTCRRTTSSPAPLRSGASSGVSSGAARRSPPRSA